MSRDRMVRVTDYFQDLKLQCVNLPFCFSPAFPTSGGVANCATEHGMGSAPQIKTALPESTEQCPRHEQGTFCQSAAQIMCNFPVVLVSTYHSSKLHNGYSRALCANRCEYQLGDSMSGRQTLKGQARMLIFQSVKTGK